MFGHVLMDGNAGMYETECGRVRNVTKSGRVGAQPQRQLVAARRRAGRWQIGLLSQRCVVSAPWWMASNTRVCAGVHRKQVTHPTRPDFLQCSVIHQQKNKVIITEKILKISKS